MHKLFEKTLNKALAGKNISEDNIEKFSLGINKTVPKIIQEIADIFYPALIKDSSAMLHERREYLREFESGHYELWQKGLDLLEAYLVAAFEAGENFNKHYRKVASKADDYMFEVLTRIHARAVHVGFEVLTLLKAGYSDGAHARQRTVHELGVISNFITMNGSELAKCYLEHEVIESYKAMILFQEHAEALGYKPYSDEYVQRVKTNRDELCKRYGKSFNGDYGWASVALSIKSPTFRDIEKASGLDHLRPYYKMASHNVHANPKGLSFRLGLSENANILLAGPSNYGLTDPAHGASISVLQATIPMLNSKPTIDSLVIGFVLQKFVDDIGQAFIKVEKEMKTT